jgi:16S rRNA (adenine1518-N6/adenine1519-N6)-dimethyltransferase
MRRPPNRSPSPDAPATSAKAQLEQHGLRPKRTLGQNFLADVTLCRKIATLVCPDGTGSVLEIGAGLGALTAPLLESGARVVAVETDRQLAAVLRDKFAAELEGGQLTLLEADARELDLGELLVKMDRPRALAGNLPYHLSGLLLRRAIEASEQLDRSAFLLQLEVVDRLCAAPATAAYGALSVFAQAVYAPARAFIVRRGAFYPQPGVDSAAVLLTPLRDAGWPLTDEFTALVRSVFEKRRKTLRNAWRDVLGMTVAELEDAARDVNIDLNSRGETLGVADFARMARRVGELKNIAP